MPEIRLSLSQWPRDSPPALSLIQRHCDTPGLSDRSFFLNIYTVKEDQDWPSQNMPFGIEVIFELKAFEFLKPLICLKAEPPSKNETVIIPLPGQPYNLSSGALPRPLHKWSSLLPALLRACWFSESHLLLHNCPFSPLSLPLPWLSWV